ncbi:hypothetical protein NADFUDRAFT_53008 [Nadsonia fulvescens var. elongata DSM 6958]|uniref:Transcription regulator Rua1 C-terminal domain-containing protein n=1 Tax=Nadsonia fulvescens var. elongata DSM 6958 TaxID=857566 RepID=A0A1E3PF47_9ASCO|nr:hypothetical protein NADFUDRAFT_53008 [Nadsonia fulvescens var. elongata DSM 6958]
MIPKNLDNILNESEGNYRDSFSSNHFLGELEAITQANQNLGKNRVPRTSKKRPLYQDENSMTQDNQIVEPLPSLRYDCGESYLFQNSINSSNSGFFVRQDGNFGFQRLEKFTSALNTIDTTLSTTSVYKQYKSIQIPNYFENSLHKFDDSFEDSEYSSPEQIEKMSLMGCDVTLREPFYDNINFSPFSPTKASILNNKLGFQPLNISPEEILLPATILGNSKYPGFGEIVEPSLPSLHKLKPPQENSQLPSLVNISKESDKEKPKVNDEFVSKSVKIKREIPDTEFTEELTCIPYESKVMPSASAFLKDILDPQRVTPKAEIYESCTDPVLLLIDAFRNQPEISSSMVLQNPKKDSIEKAIIETHDKKRPGKSKCLNGKKNLAMKRKNCPMSCQEAAKTKLTASIIIEEAYKNASCEHEGCRINHNVRQETQFATIYEKLPSLRFAENRFKAPNPSTYKKWGKLIINKLIKGISQDQTTGEIIFNENFNNGTNNDSSDSPITCDDLYNPVFRRKVLRKYALHHSNSTINEKHLDKIKIYQSENELFHLSYDEIVDIMPSEAIIKGPKAREDSGAFLEPEGYCGTCNEFFEMRDGEYALHMRSRHGLCPPTRGSYSLPQHIRVVKNVNKITHRYKSSILTRTQGWCEICQDWQNLDHQISKPWALWWEHQEDHRKIKGSTKKPKNK